MNGVNSDKTIYCGGPYGDLEDIPGTEKHHMPPWNSFPKEMKNMKYRELPAIHMDTNDHAKTLGHSGKGLNELYDLMYQGKYDEVVKLMVDDVRSKFPGKYDDAIDQFLIASKDYKKIFKKNLEQIKKDDRNKDEDSNPEKGEDKTSESQNFSETRDSNENSGSLIVLLLAPFKLLLKLMLLPFKLLLFLFKLLLVPLKLLLVSIIAFIKPILIVLAIALLIFLLMLLFRNCSLPERLPREPSLLPLSAPEITVIDDLALDLIEPVSVEPELAPVNIFDERTQMLFVADSSSLLPNTSVWIDGVANELSAHIEENPNVMFEVIGHIAVVPGIHNPMILSLARANRIVSELTARGINASNLHAISGGETNRWGDNTNEVGRAPNRRVVIQKIE